ncbi:reverse transcriptase [Trichonephila clavipes]|nr:reverse transcriptase [Trichonephila clavipes]
MYKCTTTTQKTRSLEKPWETLAIVGAIPRLLKRDEAVACFRLPLDMCTYLYEYTFHWLGLAAYESCPLCGHARMDSNHLRQCGGLNEHPSNDVVSRYWET